MLYYSHGARGSSFKRAERTHGHVCLFRNALFHSLIHSLMETLLEKAKNLRMEHILDQEKIELAIAWVKDEIDIHQVATVLQVGTANAFTIIALALRQNMQEKKNLL